MNDSSPDAGVVPVPDPSPAAPLFNTLPLDPKLLRAVAEAGYEAMTPIQAKAIPLVLAGRDIMGAAQTGTGKTAAFTIPLLQKMLRHENASMSPARHPVRALVIAPTRELADQVAASVEKYAKHTLLRSMVVFGGVDIKPQTAELRKGVEVLVATPGRLLDHIEGKSAILNQVEYVVLDEADRMLDIGFLPDLQRILSYLPKDAADPALLGHLLARDQAPGRQLPAGPPDGGGGAPERHGHQRRAALLQRHRRRQARRGAPDAASSANSVQALVFVNSKLGAARLARSFERDGLQHPGAARRQEPGRAPEGAGGLQGGRSRPAGGHRRGRARAGHRRPAGGLQLRRAVQRRGLRAPHRPHRPRRRVGAGRDAGHARRHAQHRRHRKAHQEEDRTRAVRTRRRPPAAPAPAFRRRRCPVRAGRRRGAAPARRAPCASPPADPIFDRPYEAPPANDSLPAWEAAKAAAPAPAASLRTTNIRPRRKVASLLGGSKA